MSFTIFMRRKLSLMIEKPSINFIYNRWKHHAEHSGYDMLVPQLGTGLALIDYYDRRKRLVPWRFVNYFVGQRSGIYHYSHHQFYSELSAALHMFSNRRNIYHFLYGDFDYRYLGLLDGLNGNRVVASFHLPSWRLTQFVNISQHFSRLAAAIVVGKNQIPFFEQYLDPRKVHWIPHGVDTGFFQPLREYSHGGGSRVLFVGQHLRDFDTLKKVIGYLEKNMPMVEVAIVVSDELKTEFSRFRSVKVFTHLTDAELLALYHTSDIMMLPVLDATAMNAMLEGMACGLPIVVTDTGGVRDYVDESCAILVPIKDPEAMYVAVCELLSDHTRRRKMGENSRNKSIQFDWAGVTSLVQKVYYQLNEVN